MSGTIKRHGSSELSRLSGPNTVVVKVVGIKQRVAVDVVVKFIIL